jgi:lipopolysaccharide export system protein LptA
MIRHRKSKLLHIVVSCILIFIINSASAQVPPPPAAADKPDTLKLVKIISTDRYGYKKIDSLTELLMLVGHVVLKQETTTFYADSAIFNRNTKIVEAFKNVHINDNDSVNIYSDYLLYHTDTKIATLKKAVRLTDGKSNLYTEELEYDMNQKTGVYTKGGRVVNGTSVLTSTEATYYSEMKDVYFKQNVVLKDPKYNLTTDSLLYNTNSQIATFIAKTYIEDSAKRNIVTSDGYYDMKNKNASFGKRPIIKDGSTTTISDQLISDDQTGISIFTGNVVFKDTAQGISLLSNNVITDRNKGSLFATEKPLLIIKQDKDSTFITADSLYSGKFSELPVPGDSAALMDTSVKKALVVNQGDTALRFFRAYHNVRIFSDSMQAVCDSLFYSGKDSIFRLFNDPIIWASNSQVTGDTIYLYTKNKKPDLMRVFENGLMINKTGIDMYNQIKGNRLFGYFDKGNITSVRAKGNAESVYYAKDGQDKLIGINRATSDIIDMRFKNKELNRVVFISSVSGTMLPVNQATDQDKRLRSFKWLDEKRPKTKFELFGN